MDCLILRSAADVSDCQQLCELSGLSGLRNKNRDQGYKMKFQGKKTRSGVGPHAPLFLERPTDKGIVVFIHGFMGSPRQFDRLAETVYREGRSAATLLLPGHGGSAKEFESGTFERWQGYVDAEVERFAKDYNDIWLVGHSMGGLLAINAAVKYSDYIRGIQTIATPFELTKSYTHSTKVRIMSLFSRGGSSMKSAYLAVCSIQPSPSLLWRTARPIAEVKKLMQAARDNLPDVSVPVTAVFSVSDELTSISSLDIIREGLKRAVFKHLLLTDSLHAYYPEHELSQIESALVSLVLA